MKEQKRLALEKQVVHRMIDLYCRDHHGGPLCDECSALKTYADERIARCPFGEEKTACKHCEIHCYREPEKTRIKEIMRYSGPKIMTYAPLTSIRYLAMKVLYRIRRSLSKNRS